MTQITRKQRQKELREKEEIQELQNEAKALEKTEEIIFKEQKQRLRKQLNDVTSFSVDANEIGVKPNRLQTRMEIKKQKKIDDILKDIAVLPNDKYLDEDTNLRILKKMSVAKQYNKLQLSDEQEEKMRENKARFDSITNQLWFMIQELEAGNVVEPEMGEVPTISTRNEANRQFFDLEVEKENVQNVKPAKKEISEEELSATVEQKLTEVRFEEDGDLTQVLHELDKVVQDGKKIAQEEVTRQQYNTDGVISPDDTLELLGFLQDLEDEKRKVASIDLTGEQVAKMKSDGDAARQEVARETEELRQLEEMRKADDQRKIKEQEAVAVKKVEADRVMAEQKARLEREAAEALKAKEAAKVIADAKVAETQPVKVEAPSTESLAKESFNNKVVDLTQPINVTPVEEKTQSESKSEIEEVEVQKTAPVEKQVEAQSSDVKEAKQNQEVSEQKEATTPVQPEPTTKHVDAEKTNQELKPIDKIEIDDDGEKKSKRLQMSILVLSVLFIGLLIATVFYLLYLIQTGQLSI